MPIHTEILIPVRTYFGRKILKAVLFRFYPIGYPFVGVDIASGRTPFKYVGSLSMQRLSQVCQQYFQGLIRCFLLQSNTKPFIDDGFQILHVLYTVLRHLVSGAWNAFAGLFKYFFRITHINCPPYFCVWVNTSIRSRRNYLLIKV